MQVRLVQVGFRIFQSLTQNSLVFGHLTISIVHQLSLKNIWLNNMVNLSRVNQQIIGNLTYSQLKPILNPDFVVFKQFHEFFRVFLGIQQTFLADFLKRVLLLGVASNAIVGHSQNMVFNHLNYLNIL